MKTISAQRAIATTHAIESVNPFSKHVDWDFYARTAATYYNIESTALAWVSVVEPELVPITGPLSIALGLLATGIDYGRGAEGHSDATLYCTGDAVASSMSIASTTEARTGRLAADVADAGDKFSFAWAGMTGTATAIPASISNGLPQWQR